MNALLECIKAVEQSDGWYDAVDSNFTLSVYLKPIYREWCRHQCNCMQCDATLLHFTMTFLIYTLFVFVSQNECFYFVLCHSKFIHIHNRTQPYTDTHTLTYIKQKITTFTLSTEFYVAQALVVFSSFETLNKHLFCFIVNMLPVVLWPLRQQCLYTLCRAIVIFVWIGWHGFSSKFERTNIRMNICLESYLCWLGEGKGLVATVINRLTSYSFVLELSLLFNMDK